MTTSSSRPRAPRRRIVAGVTLASVIVGIAPALIRPAGAAIGDNVVGRTTEDSFDTVNIEQWVDGKPILLGAGKIGTRTRDLSVEIDKPKPVPPTPPSRVHPLIAKWLAGRNAADVVRVLVSTNETLTIPRFPEPDGSLPRTDAVNQRVLAQAQSMTKDLQARRAESNKQLVGLLGSLGGKVVEQFWLVPTVAADIKVGAIKELLANQAVTYVEPDQTTDRPPADANPSNDVDDARARIQSDPYFNQGLTGGWIGLLDTGVRASHTLLTGRIAIQADCVNGGASCLSGAINTTDDCWNHGTSSAAIISGNNNQGNPQRGVTEIQIDSWKVYPSTVDSFGNCTGSLSTTAVVRGFQQAVAWLDRVIVAEMQGSGNESSSISLAADGAFNAGSVVVAANGNNGPGASTVNTPAVAHRVIGVGAIDTQTGTQYAGQSRGPAADGRIKPDIQTPNNSETASTGCTFGIPCAPMSNTADRVFGGTSGAVPYGGAAAALARKWMLRFGSVDPGHVYARLILSGENQYPFDNTKGAGLIHLPVNGYSWWGKVSVGNGDVIDIPLSIAAGKHDLDGALWWPESGSLHNDIDVKLVSPSGVVVASSISVASVFERARAAGTLTAGTWKLRIRGYSVTGTQTVYYGATVRN
jgi:serine protease AprX